MSEENGVADGLPKSMTLPCAVSSFDSIRIEMHPSGAAMISAMSGQYTRGTAMLSPEHVELLRDYLAHWTLGVAE